MEKAQRQSVWPFVVGLFTGESFPPRMMRLVTSAAARAVVIVLPALLGIVVSLDSQNIANSSRRFLQGEWGPPYALGVAVWVFGLAWLLLQYVRVVTDDYERRTRQENIDSQVRERLRDATEKIRQAIVRSPDLDILPVYPHFLRRAAAELADPHYGQYFRRRRANPDLGEGLDAEDLRDLKELEQRIRNVLHAVAVMARRFGRRRTAAVYGCSVLLVEKRDNHAPAPFSSLARGGRTLLFNDRAADDLGWLEAVLFSSVALRVAADTDDHPWLNVADAADESDAIPNPRPVSPSTRFEPHPFALPVPTPTASPTFRVLPGSPEVLKVGWLSVHVDTAEYADKCADFSVDVREQARAHFGPDGWGKEIRSFAAFRIGSQAEPVGVLNLMCTETHLLGEVPEYYATFTSQLAPFLQVLARSLVVYSGILCLAWRSTQPVSVEEIASADVAS